MGARPKTNVNLCKLAQVVKHLRVGTLDIYRAYLKQHQDLKEESLKRKDRTAAAFDLIQAEPLPDAEYR